MPKWSWVQPTRPLLPPTLPRPTAREEGPQAPRSHAGSAAVRNQGVRHALYADTLCPLFEFEEQKLGTEKRKHSVIPQSSDLSLLPFNQPVIQT